MLKPRRETIMFYPCIENFSGFHWWTKHNASNKQRAKELDAPCLQMYALFHLYEN